MLEVGLYSTSITCVALVLIGTLIGSANLRPNRPDVSGAIYFVVLCYSLAMWLAANIFSDLDTKNALFWVRLSFASITVALSSLLLFVNNFPVRRRIPKTESIFNGVLLIVVLGLTFSSLLVPRIIIENGVSTVVPGYAYGLFVGYVIYMLLLSMLRLVVGRKKMQFRHRAQVNLILSGVLITAIVAIATNLVLPLLVGNNDLYWVASISTLGLVGATAYAVAKQGLFDVKFAAVRTFGYILSLATLAGIYSAVAYLISVAFFNDRSSSEASLNPINIILALGLAFVFQPIKAIFDKITDRAFFRNRYNAADFYSRLSEVLATTAGLRELLQRSGDEITKTIKIDFAFFVLRVSQDKKIVSGDNHKNFPETDLNELDTYVRRHGDQAIVTDLLPRASRIRRILLSHKILLLVPLMRAKDTPGYLMLGEHKGGGYTTRDIGVIEAVAGELTIAIQNALSVQEVRDINAHLQQRIDAATNELRMSNARLKRLDAAKDEFISMASHQLRTPLTSVKGYLSMVLEGDVGKVTKMQRQVLEEAYSSSERMVHLIHDFLNVSRLQTGKFALETQQSDISKLVAEEVKSLERVATSHGLMLELKDTVGPLTMTLDDTKIRQVVMNYIDNAIFYSHSDTTIAIRFEKVANEVVFTVKDTGIGVPKKEQSQLFGKFFRASNARKERPDGTGVGLFLAKKIIDAHHGEVIFSSSEGRGSTFGFRLPIGALDKRAHKLENKPR